MKKLFLMSVGCLCVVLAAIGIFLPLLPTTPFLLLAAACFLHSSPKFHHWLLHHRVFGKFISDYVTHRAMSRRTKFFSIVLVVLSFGYSVVFVVSQVFVKILLVLIAVGVIIHLLSLGTLPRSYDGGVLPKNNVLQD